MPKRQTSYLTIIALSLLCANSLCPANEEAIQQIEDSGGTVRQIAASVEDREAAFHLSDKVITDDALKPLHQIEKLVWLYLQGTKITDDGLDHIAGIKTLTKLHLEKTQVGDEGVQKLAGLENLEYLNLYGTKVSDAGLEHLKSLKSLKKLYLWQTAVTEEGAEAFRKAMPETEVVLGAKLAVVKPAEPKEPAETKKDGEKSNAEKPEDKNEEKDEPPKTSTKGKFVRVRLQGDNRILSLAEVKVLKTGDGAPLHVQGKASQSSVDYGGKPKRASDGSAKQNYNDGSVTHTKTEKDPWWQIELADVEEIGRIKIYNRSDCCGDRLQDAIVEILDESQKVVWEKKVTDAKDGSVHTFDTDPKE